MYIILQYFEELNKLKSVERKVEIKVEEIREIKLRFLHLL